MRWVCASRTNVPTMRWLVLSVLMSVSINYIVQFQSFIIFIKCIFLLCVRFDAHWISRFSHSSFQQQMKIPWSPNGDYTDDFRKQIVCFLLACYLFFFLYLFASFATSFASALSLSPSISLCLFCLCLPVFLPLPLISIQHIANIGNMFWFVFNPKIFSLALETHTHTLQNQ